MEGTSWRRVTEQQVRELGGLRRVVAASMRRLRGRVTLANRKAVLCEREEKEYAGLLAEIVRLSQVQMKVIALEQSLLRELQQGALSDEVGGKEQGLSEEDWQILQDAMGRMSVAAGGAVGVDVEIPMGRVVQEEVAKKEGEL